MVDDCALVGTGRRTRVVASPSSLRRHDHVAWCGDGSADLLSLAVQAFRAAAARGEQLMFVSEDADPGVFGSPGGLDDLDQLINSGTLQCQTIGAAYDDEGVGVDDRRAQFLRLADEAIARGYSGLCVVADNSVFASGTDEEFAAWLAWEAAADEIQSTVPINGICYFDRARVPVDRLADVATLHPVRSRRFETPSFQLFFDDGVVRVLGVLETANAEQLTRVLTNARTLAGRKLDLSGVEFANHHGLLALAELANGEGPVLLRAAPSGVQRVWELLGRPERLEFVA